MQYTKLGVLSDTHGEYAATLQAIRLFREQNVSAIIHCGDIGGSDIIRAFKGISTHFVFGNVDGENEWFRQAAGETGNTMHGWFGDLELEGRRIFFLHGHQEHKFDEAKRSGQWDLICYGHTHVASFEVFGETLMLNPGAFRRVATPRIAVVQLPELTVESLAVSSPAECFIP